MRRVIRLCLLLIAMAAPLRAASPTTTPTPIDDHAFLVELSQVHEERLAALLKQDPKIEKDLDDAILIFQNVNKLIGEGKLQEALGEERAYVAAVGPMMERDGRAAEIHFLLDTLARLGEDDGTYDMFLNQLGVACLARGGPADAARAVRYLVASVNGFERSSRGRPNSLWARAVHNLGMAQMHAGDLAASVATLRKAGPLVISALGRNEDYAQWENDLGEALRESGTSPREARQHLNAAEQWVKNARAKQDTPELQDSMAIVLHNKALLSMDEGDLQQTRALEEAALPLTTQVILATKGTPQEKLDQALRGRILRQLGVLPLLEPPRPPSIEALTEAMKSEDYLGEAIVLLEQTNGHNNPETVCARLSLGMIYALEGKYDQAGMMIDPPTEAEQYAEPQFRIELLRLRSSLAIMAGRYDIANDVTRQWSELATRLLGSSNQFAIGAEFNLATIQTDTHQFAEAEKTFKDVLKSSRRTLDLAFASEPERRQLICESAFRKILDGYLSLKWREHWAGDGGYDEVLRWKGSVFAHQVAIGRVRAKFAADFDRLEKTTREISALTHEQASDFPQSKEDAAWKRRQQERWNRIEALNGEIEQITAKLSASSDSTSSPSVDAAAIRKLLPSKVALVDFIEYGNRDEREANGRLLITPRYIAYVVQREKITPIDLGPAEPIDKAARQWTSDRCRDSKIGLEVRKLIWDKISPALGGAKLILVSPDASLGNVAFGALPDADGSYLIERYAFVSVAVPQLLPGLLQPTPSPAAQALLISSEIPKPGEPIVAPRNSLWARQHRLEKESAAEISHIQHMFSQAAIPWMLRIGPDASITQFRNAIPHATLLHYAGHGFFLPIIGQRLESRFQETGGEALGQTAAIDSSLLCGLLLAPDAANHDSGELTAYEIARMDLHNLNLAVLSGCDTANGESAGGEGLLSLQRAFQIAGAHTVIASLWPVEDDATEHLMTYFYTELLSTPRSRTLPLVALRHAQLRVMREAPLQRHTIFINGPALAANEVVDRALPAAWAPWALSGSPGDLQEIVRELESESH